MHAKLVVKITVDDIEDLGELERAVLGNHTLMDAIEDNLRKIRAYVSSISVDREEGY